MDTFGSTPSTKCRSKIAFLSVLRVQAPEVHSDVLVSGQYTRRFCPTTIAVLILVGAGCTENSGRAAEEMAPSEFRMREVASTESCPDCRIVAERVTTLGSTDGVSLPGSVRIAVTSRGQFVAAPTYNPGEIVLYDSKGHLLRRFGRHGQGPGEFARINRVEVGPADTIHVFEGARHSVIAPGLTHLVSVGMLPLRPQRVAFMSDGLMVLQTMVLNKEGIGDPVHLINGKRQIIKSFGGLEPWHQHQRYQLLRAIAPAPDNRLWLGRITQYRLELWDASGANVKTFVRKPEWFRPWTEEELVGPWDALRRPRITAISLDSFGRLWVISQLPDPDWAPPQAGEAPAKAFNPDEAFDSVIEVLDPETGTVVARTRPSNSIRGFYGDSILVHTQREAEDGNILIDVWRLRLNTDLQR